MGLTVKTISKINSTAERSNYIYLLDYGWKESLISVLHDNFDRLASLAEDTDSVIVRGIKESHFSDEVLSWHKINGETAGELLPAILITNRHPSRFQHFDTLADIDMDIWDELNDITIEDIKPDIESNLRLVLVPIRKFCSTSEEVLELIEKLFIDIKHKKNLSDFRITQKILKKDGKKADALILEPNNSNFEDPYAEFLEFLTDIEDRTIVEAVDKSIRDLRNQLSISRPETKRNLLSGIAEFESKAYLSSARIIWPSVEEIANQILLHENLNMNRMRGLRDKLNKLEELMIIEHDLADAINVTSRNKILHANFNPNDEELARPFCIEVFTYLSRLIRCQHYNERRQIIRNS